ncbi:esterase/lipase family protein [Luteolibacter luteus]|uniref:Alpha/beta fold hydrolase n=1 Tax=Luteolibacter luteus TaxID=2728835 RepID=A0A858RM04_9BACT|nr:alpha/beta fold hydrolase [Luteolibacter luteus]QJE97755.1 alpha/beta fold hydrolase [Luteolibacter luteus]
MRLLTLFTTVLLVSCSAPISFKQGASVVPAGDYHVSPLAEALQELDAGKKSKDPTVACGHFVESARLAGTKALAGETGALALYNHAVGRLVETLSKEKNLPWGRRITVGTGDSAYTLAGKLEPNAPSYEREYVPVDSMTFHGKWSGHRAIRPGVGAPLVVIGPENREYRRTFDPPRVHAAMTAILRFEGHRSATLELHEPLEEEKISIAGRNPTLAADFTAPISMYIAVARPDKLGLIRLLNPQKYSDTARLIRTQKYDKNRIPVLFVHGLQDTPATWVPMYQQLLNDPVLRDRYQFWVFSYPSGYPFPYSASLLRKELDGVNKAFPGHKDIVIVGHSMGGIISRLMVTNAGDRIWKDLFGKSPAETKVSGASRHLLEESLVFEHRKEIRRAIFIATPHKGSIFASNWIGRLGSRLVRIPSFLADTRNAVASLVTVDTASMQLDRAPNSIDTLAPNNRFVISMNKLPIDPGVTYHSIIGDRGKGDTPNSSDGVVAYWSSHLDHAASEKIVPSGHSAHQNPEGIEEVKRILKLHLKTER